MSRSSYYRRISLMLSVLMMLTIVLPPNLVQAEQQKEQQQEKGASTSNQLFQHAYTFNLTDAYKSIELGHLDNNNIMDFVVLTNRDLLVIYKNQADGSTLRETVIMNEPLASIESNRRIKVEDLDGDNRPEIIASSNTGIHIFVLNTVGKYEQKMKIPKQKSNDFVVVDFNHDGIKDLIFATSTHMYSYKGTGNLNYVEITGLRIADYTGKIVTGDWNKDGNADYAIYTGSRRSSSTDIYFGKEDGTFTSANCNKMYHSRDPFSSDVNKDGYDEVVVGISDVDRQPINGKINICYGSADSKFHKNEVIDFETGMGSQIQAVTDFNGDGYPDFLHSKMYASDGSELFWNDRGKKVTPSYTINFEVNQIKDVNSDGLPDIIRTLPNKVEIHLNVMLGSNFQFELSEQVVLENRKSVKVKVVRTGNIQREVSLRYETKSGTAQADIDYRYQKETIQFGKGEVEKWIAIPLLGTDIPREGRHFSIELMYPGQGDSIGANASIHIKIADAQTTPPVDTSPLWPRDSQLIIRNVSVNSLTVQWSAALDTEGIASYTVRERSQAITPITVQADVYSHTWDSGLQPGKTYVLEVTAEDKSGHSNEPLTAAVTIPNQPTAPTDLPYYHKKTYHTHKYRNHVRPIVADVDSNGIDDFVLTYALDDNSYPKLEQWKMLNFHGGNAIASPFPDLNICNGTVKERVDFNNNGRDDIVITDNTRFTINDVTVCMAERSDVDGSFVKRKEMKLNNYLAHVTKDFTGDGWLDILYSTRDFKLVLLQGGADYKFTELKRSNVLGSLLPLTTGDWNGDSHMDIASRSSDNILIYTNQGDHTFVETAELPASHGTKFDSSDIDLDGDSDLIVELNGSFYVYYGDAHSPLANKKVISTGAVHTTTFALHDFNQDGKDDLLFIAANAFKVAMNQNGQFSTSFISIDQWSNENVQNPEFFFGEFTGDGNIDISIMEPKGNKHFLYTANFSSSTLQFGQEAAKVQEHAGQVQLQLKRVGDRQSVTSVVYETVDGTGLAGVDYVASTGVLTFAAGETEKTITIPLIDNNKRNAERSFTVKLSSPTRGAKLGEPNQMVVQIEDDEQDPPQWPVGAALMPIDVTSSSLTLSWPAAKGKGDITAYLITEKNGLLPPVSVPCYVLAHRWSTGLLAGGTYQFEVRAKNNKGLVSEPLTRVVTLPAVEVPPIDPPDELPPQWPAGASLQPSNVNESMLTLSWPSAIGTNAIMAYELRETNGALAPVSVTGQVYSHTWNSGLEAGKTYQFELKALDAKGLPSAPLLTVVTLPDAVVPPIDPPVDPPVIVPVKAPKWPAGAIAQYKDVSVSTLTLLWPSAVDTDGVASYRIRETSNALSPVTVTGQVYSHTWNNGLTAGKTYQFEVTAQDKTGLAGVPLIVKVTLPNHPSIQPPRQPSYGGPIGGAPLSNNKAVASVQLFEQGVPNAMEAVWSKAAGRYEFTTEQEQIEMEVKPDHKAATVWIDSKQWEGKKQLPLKLGVNEFKFTVKAENGDKLDYNLLIVRKEKSNRSDKIDTSVLKPCSFLDVGEHWAGVRICEAYSQGLVQGITADEFKPDQTLTRAEFAVLLARLSGVEKKQAETLRFKDSGHIPAWAVAAVQLAVEKGWIVGYEDGAFRPDEQVTRAELAAIVARVMDWEAATEEQGQQSVFQDAATIPDWAKRSVLALQKHGVIQGKKDGRYAPVEAVTRAEAATLLLRLKKLLDSE